VVGLPAYFLGKEGVLDGMLLPEVIMPNTHVAMPHFK